MRGFWFSMFWVGLVGVLSTGCRPSTPFFDKSGEAGSTTSTGEGGSGGDIFTTGGGAGGAAVCAGSCVAGKPAWFDGLSLFWIGPPDEAPPCSDLGLVEGSTGYADPIAPTPCPSCSCSPAACVLPEGMHASAAKCADAGGAPSIAFDAPAGWEGTCSTENAITGGLSCSGVPCVQSLTIAAPDVAPCMPVTLGDPDIPPHAWGTMARECVIWPVSGEGCTTGQACVPVPTDRYSVCLYREGDHSADPGFVCPAAYPRPLVVYASYEDTRACEPCACGEPEGAECAALVSVFKDGACGGILGSITLASGEPGCLDLPSGSALGSKSASFVLDQPGSCAQSGGGPAGTFEPLDPVTLCCEPDPEPAH